MVRAFVLLLLWTAASAQALELRLREQAEVTRATYTLGEIADIDDADATTRARLAALPIGQPPRSGQAQIVTREAIDALLRRLNVLHEPPTWSGATQIVVRERGAALDLQQVTDRAARALFDAWAPSLAGLEARAVGTLPTLSVPTGTVSLLARPAASAALARRMLVHVEVLVDGRSVTTLPVWFAVKAMSRVRVARASLPRGEPLREDAFVTSVQDVTAYASPPLPADAPLAGLRLRGPVDAQKALTAADVEDRPAVQRNEPVRVRVQLGPVTLDTVGIALADARIGQLVRIRNPASQDAYSARVLADGAVLADGKVTP